MNTLRSILVHMDDADACQPRLALSTKLAESCGAQLSALYVSRFLTQSLLVDAPPSGMLLQALEEEQRARTAKARALFESSTSALGENREFQQQEGDPVRWLSVYGRYADVIVVHQPGGEEPPFGVGGIAGALALGCGRPLLVVPRTGARSLIPDRVLVAWNGSREAARAVADALPFLHMASHVEAVSVTDGQGPDNGAPGVRELCRHLALHGVEAEPILLPKPEIEIPEALLSRAASQSADMIVLGAYGHSRFRELVLGGVTRNFLAHSAIPLLLSH